MHSKQEESMSDKISVKGLDKAAVFAALYNGARAQGLGFLHYTPDSMSAREAQERFGPKFGFYDYVDGRVMKVDLSGDEFDPWLYDRDNGQGAAEMAINVLRGSVSDEEVELRQRENTRTAAIDALRGIDKKSSIEGGTVKLGLGDFEDKLTPKLRKILGNR